MVHKHYCINYADTFILPSTSISANVYFYFIYYIIQIADCFVYNCSACLLNCPLGTNKVVGFF